MESIFSGIHMGLIERKFNTHAAGRAPLLPLRQQGDDLLQYRSTGMEMG